MRRSSGLSKIIAGTVVAGIAGYLVTWLVYREIGAANYSRFAVYWAAIYLVVGALSGVQQEITRATYPVGTSHAKAPGNAKLFALVSAGTTFVVIVGSSPLWSGSVFRTDGMSLVWPLAIGAASYVLVAVLSGTLYGVSQWRSLALMIAVDGVLRFVALAIGLTIANNDVVSLAWLVAIPFPLAIMVLWPFIRQGVVGRTELDVGYSTLSWNVCRTIFASAATAVLVSGFPLLLGVVARNTDPSLVGELIFTITLARAPLIVTIMSLQSYLVVLFRNRAGESFKMFLLINGLILGCGGMLSLVAGVVGPVLLGWLTGRSTSLDGSFIAVLVASSAVVGALGVSGSAVLARSQHFAYSAGWVVAALVTISLMVLPVDLIPRVGLTLLVGPLAGLIVHMAWLVFNPSPTPKTVNG